MTYLNQLCLQVLSISWLPLEGKLHEQTPCSQMCPDSQNSARYDLVTQENELKKKKKPTETQRQHHTPKGPLRAPQSCLPFSQKHFTVETIVIIIRIFFDQKFQELLLAKIMEGWKNDLPIQ